MILYSENPHGVNLYELTENRFQYKMIIRMILTCKNMPLCLYTMTEHWKLLKIVLYILSCMTNVHVHHFGTNNIASSLLQRSASFLQAITFALYIEPLEPVQLPTYRHFSQKAYEHMIQNV